jgi:bifunctional non-homologous end joining protein LigD
VAKLKTYRAKRDFGKTSEPRGAAGRKKGNARGNSYVIQKHAATRLHYDLRLELNGVMLSWAVTRGPSLVPGDKRLAIHVEDHPIEYNTFEGTIPKGQYGGGTVMIWDRGKWSPEFDPDKGMKKGHLEFTLHGKKLKGRWHLVRMNKRPGERQEPWLLIKGEDDFARSKSDPDVLEELPNSAASRRTMEQIAEGRSRVWHSNRPASEQSSRRVAPKKPRGGAAREKRSRPLRSKAAAEDSKEKPAGSLRGVSRTSGARRITMPEFVTPSLATLSANAPASADWVHEIKFDGYRIQARISRGSVALRTRTGLDWTGKFPTVAQALAALKRHDAIIDGEIVSGDARGVADFSALQDDLKNGRHDRLVYYAFDLLHLDGYDLTSAVQIERKQILAELIGPIPGNIVRLSEHFETSGPRMLALAREMRLEGVVSKRRDAPYRSGRNGEWLKIKCSDSQELVVAGYGPSDVSPKRVRALVLGYYDKLGLTYAGRVGTGFSDRMRDDFWQRLQPLRVDRSPFGHVPEEERGRPVHWVKPQIVVEVDFRGWTGGGRVRQASFKGIREDKPAKHVVREIEQVPGETKQAALRQSVVKKTKVAAGKKKGAVTVAGVTLTHPDRVYWDDAGVTKTMLAEYYEEVWNRMQPHVAGRVLALVRCPDGQSGQCFYQKHASAGIDQEHLLAVKEPDGEISIAIDSVSGLVALAQSGVLEVHVRGSTIEHLEQANRLVFDLDPGPGVGWKDVIDAAREVRERLAELKLKSFVKTTGGKGLHVVLPIRPAPWDEAKEFCRLLAEGMAADNPKRYTATIKKSARNNKIFVDYLRNSREATAIAPYSTRARPGATVSVPLSWDELGKQKTPNAFSVLNLPKRLSRTRSDPWAAMGKLRQALPPAPKRR